MLTDRIAFVSPKLLQRTCSAAFEQRIKSYLYPSPHAAVEYASVSHYRFASYFYRCCPHALRVRVFLLVGWYVCFDSLVASSLS